jgi:hypothetical protein
MSGPVDIPLLRALNDGDIGPIPVESRAALGSISPRDANDPRPGIEPAWLRRPEAMKNRREFLLTLTAGVVALAVIITPVIAEELFGVIISVDVPGKKLTVIEKGSDEETVVTTTDDTEYVSGRGESSLLDLEKLSKNVAKYQEAGKKGFPAKVTHEKGVASKIEAAKKKAANP